MAPLSRIVGRRGGSATYSSLDENLGSAQQQWQHSDSCQTRPSALLEVPSYPFSEDILSFGKPDRKRMFYNSDIAMAIVALASLALSVLVVSNGYISWCLGISNRQLIVIGFLLSIMSLCLASVTPTLWILLEARFGDSSIQNYDAILRNKPMASRLSFIWRVVLVAMLSLPIGLSVSYKTFTGGDISRKIQSTDYIPETSYYGLHEPPGIISSNGISSFFNATAAFREATQTTPGGPDPAFPVFPQSYGYNILLLNETSAAALDTLRPEYVLAVQGTLAIGESWTITAPVISTVATFDESNTKDRHALEETYQAVCNDAKINPVWLENRQFLFNEWTFVFTHRIGLSDQSLLYLGLAPKEFTCEELSRYIYVVHIDRRRCMGTWSISRGGFQLLGGACDDFLLPWAKQQTVKWNYLALEAWYVPPLMEMLGSFSGTTLAGGRGNQSVWKASYMATSVAAMIWSRVATLESGSGYTPETYNASSIALTTENGTNLTQQDIGKIYPVSQDDQEIFYNRPTLKKSPWLYLVLAIQPAFTVMVLGLTAIFFTTPLGKGFGLISILSGIDSRSLRSLAGASLSGELTQHVKLTMRAIHSDEANKIEYRIVTSSEGIERDAKLAPKAVYH